MSLQFGHVVCSRLYGLAWRLARPLLRRNHRLADGFALRAVPDNWARPADVWLQAASGGEAYLVWELLRHLPPQPGVLRVLATTWTRQGLEVLQGMSARLSETRQDLDIQVTLFPLDHPVLMYRATGMVNPRVIVLLETELWPGLLFASTRRHIPVLVLNGRLSRKSCRNYRLLDRLAPGFWDAVGPRAVSAVSRADADRFAAILPQDRVSIAPNIKFDRAAAAAEALTASTESLTPLLPSESRIFLLASVRQEEETLLAPVVTSLLVRHPGSTVIVAPRHLHRVSAWGAALSGIPFRLRSALTPENPARPGEAVIWDTFGELSSLYNLAHAVFIGGSLAPLGGQNFLEPLSAGRVPRVGPHVDNFLWALDSESGAGSLDNQLLVMRCATPERLLESLAEPQPDPAAVRERFGRWLNSRQGGSVRCAELLQNFLTDPASSVPVSPLTTPSATRGDTHGDPS